MDLPWFKFYAAETLSDENFQGWSLEERGAWFTLLLVAWREGSIPADGEALARLLHLDANRMRTLWLRICDRFVPHLDLAGRLTSPRLEMEREEAARLQTKRSRAGKAAARSRWAKGKKNRRADSNRIANAYDRDANAVRFDAHPDPDPDQIESQPASVSVARLDPLRRALAGRLNIASIGIGRDLERVSATFGKWLDSVGLDATVAECERLAAEKHVVPAHLSWWCGWLETVPDTDLVVVNGGGEP